MQWWAWVAAGAILLGSELAFVDAQFYLVFVGSAALVVGLLQLAGAGLAMGLQWLIFALLAAMSMVTFRRRIYERMRRGLPQMHGGPVGDTVVMPAELAPGADCRLEFRGSSWSAVNGGPLPIAAGAKARIRRVEGLTLVVHGD
jgi:membrane protein implicated in regulation of membrane protease activity